MDGILIVDKPRGVTSHDIVDFIRKRFDLKKVGHAGTLDPIATGILVILIGKYTKSSGLFLNKDKEYEAALVLGATSDTLDAWGNIKTSGMPENITEKDIKNAFNKFLGPIEQIPPSYSAVKFKGKKLYELARKGIEVKLEPRKIIINKIDISEISIPEVSFSVNCSKGTYIRQLCADVGAVLGCGAYLSKLRRTRSGEFVIGEALTVDELKNMDKEELSKRLKLQNV